MGYASSRMLRLKRDRTAEFSDRCGRRRSLQNGPAHNQPPPDPDRKASYLNPAALGKIEVDIERSPEFGELLRTKFPEMAPIGAALASPPSA